MLLTTHMKNYCANRTTNERFSRTKTAKKSTKQSVKDSMVSKGTANTSMMSSSIMSFSDFNTTQDLNESADLIEKKDKKKKKGHCANFWKMSSHTKIVP